MFYSSYGSFMHSLIERFYKGELSKEQMLTTFLLDFKTEVQGQRPKNSIVEGYIRSGTEYLRSFEKFPYEPKAVEQRVEFDVGGLRFVGIIDFVGEKNGALCIVDNKSRKLKSRSHRAKPTKKDEELDKMLIQLYLYAAAVRQKYGEFPSELCFNCFRNGAENALIVEKFDETAYKRALLWAQNSIENIMEESEFRPHVDYFACKYICGVHDECCYYETG